MATAASSSMDTTKVLILGSKSMAENTKWSAFMVFVQLLDMIKHVCQNMKSTDTFTLIVPGDAISVLLADPVYKSDQVRVIYVYYANNVNLQQVKNDIQDERGKLRFYHERNLSTLIATLKVQNTLDSSGSNYRVTVNKVVSSQEERIAAKRSNPIVSRSSEPKRFASTSNHGVPVKFIEQINAPYTCPSCQALLRDPYQLFCGHRICQGCVKIENK